MNKLRSTVSEIIVDYKRIRKNYECVYFNEYRQINFNSLLTARNEKIDFESDFGWDISRVTSIRLLGRK